MTLVRNWGTRERAKAYERATTLQAAIEREVRVKAEEVAASFDPGATNEWNSQAISAVQASIDEQFRARLAELFALSEHARSVAPFNTRAAYLRQASLTVNPGAIALLIAAPDANFAAVVVEAAARGEISIVGAAGVLGRTFASAALGKQVEATIASIDLPDQLEAEEELSGIRAAFLKARRAVRTVTHPDAAAAEASTPEQELTAPLVDA